HRSLTPPLTSMSCTLSLHDALPIFCTFDNVHYLGVLKADELVSYYSLADVLLIAYKADEYKDQLSNPHKMMEYLASGKMIVATRSEEHTSELQSRENLVCRLLLEKK